LLIGDTITGLDMKQGTPALAQLIEICLYIQVCLLDEHDRTVFTAAIEVSALSRQRLNRRIPFNNQLSKEVLIIFKGRSSLGIKINFETT
jgi:hypothetical protein